MAAAVFGLTACIPGVISFGLGKFIGKSYDNQSKKIIETFHQNMQSLIDNWETEIEKYLQQKLVIKPNSKQRAFDLLVPSCPHKKTNESRQKCSELTNCGGLRLNMQTEVKSLSQIGENEKNLRGLLRLAYVITAVTTTLLTSSFIIPLCPVLTTIHLGLSLGTAVIGGGIALDSRSAITIDLKPSPQH
ncbi:MAG: hypothetical protein K2X08_02685 [Chlamydiales bacterium]|nr:hypothetical protein [Chlamydiales bacterium]